MRDFKGKTLTDRLQDANRARQALLKKAKEAPKIDDPAVIERRAAQQASAALRQIEREKRLAAKAAKAREQAAREEQERREKAAIAARLAKEEVERLKAEEVMRNEHLDQLQREADALEAEKKAARDARYAARKARKG